MSHQFNTGYLTFSTNMSETECVITNTLVEKVDRVNKTVRFFLRSLSENYPFGETFTLKIGQTHISNGLSFSLLAISQNSIKVKLNYNTESYLYNQLGPC
jgi:hypothetical protein